MQMEQAIRLFILPLPPQALMAAQAAQAGVFLHSTNSAAFFVAAQAAAHSLLLWLTLGVGIPAALRVAMCNPTALLLRSFSLRAATGPQAVRCWASRGRAASIGAVLFRASMRSA